MEIKKIDRIERITDEMKALNEELDKLTNTSRPTFDTLASIYEKAVGMGEDRGWSICQLREYYLFVVLYVFDPSALVKRLERGGVRSDIARVMGVTINNVSHLTRHLLFHYRIYKDFRNAVDELYNISISDV